MGKLKDEIKIYIGPILEGECRSRYIAVTDAFDDVVRIFRLDQSRPDELTFVGVAVDDAWRQWEPVTATVLYAKLLSRSAIAILDQSDAVLDLESELGAALLTATTTQPCDCPICTTRRAASLN